jgi:hypothetical protein
MESPLGGYSIPNVLDPDGNGQIIPHRSRAIPKNGELNRIEKTSFWNYYENA